MAHAVLAAAAIALFGYNVHHYYFLCDDAFISFRYAHHLVEGHGLVWNRGERVEGYTNFLWVLLMAAGMVARIPPEILSNAIGFSSGLLVLAGAAWLTARRTGWDNPLVWAIPLTLAASRSFTAWCTGGLETMFFTMLVLAAFIAYIDERQQAEIGPYTSSILFAGACLTRPEGLLFAGVAALFFAADLLAGRRLLRSWLAWALLLGTIVGAHFAWRRLFYGDWLPNSFYAKINGIALEQGLDYFRLFHEDYRIGWFLPLAAVPLLFGRRHTHYLLASASAAHLAYLACIGGDVLEFRFLVIVLPLVCWLVLEGLLILAEAIDEYVGRSAVQLLIVGVIAALIACTHLGSRRPEASKVRAGGIVSVELLAQYGAWRAIQGKALRRLIDRGLLPADLRLAVTGAGAVPYYTMWPTLDLHGLCDRAIARRPLFSRSRIGHEKFGNDADMRARRIEILDTSNRLLFDAPGPNESCRDDRGCMKSVKIDGAYLNFKTFLPDRQFRSRFPLPEPGRGKRARPGLRARSGS